jgi:hypothetical protein
MEMERELVESYFESNGFLVKGTALSRDTDSSKKQNLLPSMAIFNPLAQGNDANLGFRLFTSDLTKIRSALIGLLGWENTSFSNSILTSDARILKYFKQEAKDERIAESLGSGPDLTGAGFGEFLRLLVVPALPRSEGKLRETFSFLKGLGVDGVLTMRSMLENLLRQSLPSKSYHGKSIFQILCLMKAYDLVREPQLEMFPEEE